MTSIRLWYLQQGYLELSPDEAHYWEWSRRLDWSYYSKGPFVAYLIALSTAIGGATELFVRLPAVLSVSRHDDMRVRPRQGPLRRCSTGAGDRDFLTCDSFICRRCAVDDHRCATGLFLDAHALAGLSCPVGRILAKLVHCRSGLGLWSLKQVRHGVSGDQPVALHGDLATLSVLAGSERALRHVGYWLGGV